MLKCFRQAGLFLHGIDGKVNRGDARVGEAIGYFRTQQTRIGGEINPKILFRGIVNDLMHKIRANKGSPPVGASTRHGV